MKKLKLLKKPGHELLLIIIIFTSVYPLLGQLHVGYTGQLFVHALVMILAVGTTTFVVLWKNADIIAFLAGVREAHKIKADGPLDVLFKRSVTIAAKRLDQLKSETGMAVEDDEELNMIVKACFRVPFSLYIAVDSHCPSEYYKQYPQFLDDQKVGMRPGTMSWRILAVERNDLIKDYSENTTLFYNFVRWHTDNGILLGQISPAKAKGFANVQGLKTADLGLWSNQCSLLFSPPKNSTEPLRLRYLAPDDRDYNGCKFYFRNVASEDSAISLSGGSVSFRQREANERRDALQAI